MTHSSQLHDICSKRDSVKGDLVFICRNNDIAAKNYKLSKYFAPGSHIYYFPEWDTNPYDRISPSKNISALRAKILAIFADKKQDIILFTTPKGFVQKTPEPRIFKSKYLRIELGDKIDIAYLSNHLVQNGFVRNSIATDAGEFAIRGEIFDIVISNLENYRLVFEWDRIIQIKALDPISQISQNEVKNFEIYPTNEMILEDKNAERFRGEFLKNFSVNMSGHSLYEAVSNKKLISGAEQLLPLCYDNMSSILDFLSDPKIIMPDIGFQHINEEYSQIRELYEDRINTNKASKESFYPALAPSLKYLDEKDVIEKIKNLQYIPSSNENSALNLYCKSNATKQNISKIAQEYFKNFKKIHIFCPSLSIAERVKSLLKIENIDLGKVTFPNLVLENSFVSSKEVFLRYQDFLGEKKIREKQVSSKKLKNILNELENYREGDLVTHNDHGIGKFMGIENIEANQIRHDFIKLVYAGEDKLYIPVENIDLIKKYNYEDAALDKLGNLNWQKRKAKLKNRIGELAKKLIALAAIRKTMKSEPIPINTPEYGQFCKKFLYTETEDQLSSIEDIEADLKKTYPMDRMICGDVGFGKTEVAMRAAFLVANSGKQVAIISPTTILTRQHQISFSERFKGFGQKIVSLSRLTPQVDKGRILASIKSGEATIIIGTHTLLSDNVKFKNLGLVIIDEEQHFGVAQKEKLKELKNEVHVLSMSATPIPRSLQMSVLGIKDLSLIATPPIDRLPIRTNILPNDTIIIRDALLRESARGGRSFFVVPRISDIEEIEQKMQQIAPDLKYVVAHGKMQPAKIDKIMNDFYEGKYDILLSTTIIESGIDIPAANTIIIYRAEMFGLAQLYQLRGRVGRSKVRGYAYLVVGSSKKMTDSSIKRLEVMQNLDSLGAGFAIASHDSDIRGFGNLVGDEQSGHIREVGAELYQQMLDEAISEIQDNKQSNDLSPNINIQMPIYIPNEYISDSQIRLGIYKRASSLESNEEIEDFRDELVDRFGAIPPPAQNLLSIMNLKLLCKKLKIIDLDSGPNGILLKFQEDESVSKMVMNFIAKNQGLVKLRPDHKIVILGQFKKDKLLEKITEILEHFIP